MGNSKLRGKDLRKINYKTDRGNSLAINTMSRHFKHLSKVEKLNILQDVLLHPQKYLSDQYLSQIAEEFIDTPRKKSGNHFDLLENSKAFNVFGSQHIEPDTFKQMEMLMRLPVTVAGALMPDAHIGYGLPIGGVLATDGVIIPYGVGMDIGCRMSLTLYDVPANFIRQNKHMIKTALEKHTHFGIGTVPGRREDHEVLSRSEFMETELLRQYHSKAAAQLGSSGSGNHFVEVGVVELDEENRFGLAEGNYVGLLAHSGSRGMGAAIAKYYVQVAIEKCKLPKGATHLAWLDLKSEEGLEYWRAMNLAGDFAKACHDVIHHKLSNAMGLKPLVRIENHHNFAWKEIIDNKEVIMHRKGATPAAEGQLGIIPGSMTAPGYIVSGKGNSNSLNSASHGAGRKMSRKKARESLTGSEMRKHLRQMEVTLIGGGVDEAPRAYKNLEDVMENQKDLVKKEGKFYPKIVRMDKN